MNRLFDLRFVIGSFFSVVGILLLIYSFSAGLSELSSVNKWCGGVFLIFGILMVILSFLKNAHDELLEEESS